MNFFACSILWVFEKNYLMLHSIQIRNGLRGMECSTFTGEKKPQTMRIVSIHVGNLTAGKKRAKFYKCFDYISSKRMFNDSFLYVQKYLYFKQRK